MKTTKTTKTTWTPDDGYCGCETARFGDIAVVICPPEYGTDRWGYQAFDESDEEAMCCGETYAEGYGFASKKAVKSYVEDAMQA